MKAIVIRAYGGHEVMKLDDVELPAPGAGEALVDVAVSGVNFTDTGTRRCYTKAMHTSPMTPGVEGAGTVVAVGGGVTNVKAGDRVAWLKEYHLQLTGPEFFWPRSIARQSFLSARVGYLPG